MRQGEIRLSGVEIPVARYQQPPHCICDHIIRVHRQRIVAARKIKSPQNTRIVSENRPHGQHLRVHIPYPDQTVTLYAVPDHSLHIEMTGIRRHTVNIVKFPVAAAEAAEIGYVPVSKNAQYRFDFYHGVIAEQLYADKSVSGLRELHIAEHRQPYREIAH